MWKNKEKDDCTSARVNSERESSKSFDPNPSIVERLSSRNRE